MVTAHDPVNLADSAFKHACHACAFFHSKEEEYRVLLPFILQGFERGDRAFHIVGPDQRAAHLQQLEQAGIDTAAAQAQGTLEVATWHETYMKDGQFDPDRMIATLLTLLDPANSPPGKISRNIATMEWALDETLGRHEVVEYEARLNQALPAVHDPVICTYDLAQFDASTVIDIMRTHPVVIIGGILQENPFFIPAEQMLAEIAQRKQHLPARMTPGASGSPTPL